MFNRLVYATFAGSCVHIDLLKKGIFKDVTIFNKNLTHDTGRYTASLKQPN